MLPAFRVALSLRLLRRGWPVCALACMSSGLAQNLPADNGASGSLSLAQAIELTQAHNPGLAAFSLEREAARAAVDSAVLRPPISVDAELENFAGNGEAAGTKSLEATLSLSTVLELGGKRFHRRGLATRELERLDVDQQARRLDSLAEVARRYVSVVVAQEQVNLAADNKALAREALEAVSRRVSAGASAELDRYVAQTRLARAELNELGARSALDAARVKLGVLWGEERPRFAAATGDLFTLPVLASFEQLRASLDGNPDLLRFASEARVREATLALARAQSRPDIDLAAGVRRLEDLDAEAFVLSFSMPLGSVRRSDPAIRGAQADLDRLALEERAARLDLFGTLYGLSHALDQARDSVTALRGPILEQAQQALSQAQRGYRAGRYAYLLLADAQIQLLEIRREAITAAAEYHLAALEIERLTGESMTRLSK
jgi:outer membrane protein, heavy metal efflux system